LRRTAALALAALLVLPLASPAAAADPAGPSAEPTTLVDASTPPTPSPTTEPSPTGEAAPTELPQPTPAATPDPADPGPSTDPMTPSPDATAGSIATDPDAVPLDAQGRPIANGRFIVVLKGTADTATVMTRHRKREGMHADRSFKNAFRGFTAKLDATQRKALLADPSVAAVVPDEVVQIAAQTVPTGVSRVGTRQSTIAKINGLDERVDADVAIVDTGIAAHPDLNRVGGYNCTTSNRGAWGDGNGHGTHVAGTVGALDNTIGVVGVAPGVRLWSVRILNSSGAGLLSWYVCGLDWILAQRDPSDSSRPLFEAVNMSVAKTGSDAPDCGVLKKDILHQAICRLYAAGITVVAAAANARTSAAGYVPAAYNQVITVSALADTDGLAGGRGGNRCYSWGGYDRDDTFADFSNFGSDIDIIAPGKCIYSTKPGPTYGYSSGTSMATPHVTGAVALYKSTRPLATPAEVRESLRYLGNLGWYTNTDPDRYHEPLLNVARIGNLGTFSVNAGAGASISSHGGSVNVPFSLSRSSTFFERVSFSVSGLPSGWTATMNTPSLFGWTATAGSVRVTAPSTARPGTYTIRVTGRNWGRSDAANLTISVASDLPVAKAPAASVASGTSVAYGSTGSPMVSLRATWPAATDASDAIVRYEVERSVNGGAFGSTLATSGATRSATFSGLAFYATYQFRVRAQDSDGDWSAWVVSSAALTPTLISDRYSLVTYRGTWSRYASTPSTNGGITSSRVAGSTAKFRFTGRTIAIIAPTTATRGRARIYIDGVYKTTIDLRTSTTLYRRVVYVGNWSASGTRTIEMRVEGTSGRPTVSLDGYIVLR
jgi:subtilisin family serine protease